MLRDYEILFILRPDLDEAQLGDSAAEVESLIVNLGGKVRKRDIWGRRKLAFEVGSRSEGYYVLTDFELEPEQVPELESSLKISESVFRQLIIRKDGAEPAQTKEEERADSAEPALAAATAVAADPVEVDPEEE
ncbi:MAG: 30S ribosomal protein S6 [Candidatus Dormibacteraceae bacterium]